MRIVTSCKITNCISGILLYENPSVSFSLFSFYWLKWIKEMFLCFLSTWLVFFACIVYYLMYIFKDAILLLCLFTFVGVFENKLQFYRASWLVVVKFLLCFHVEGAFKHLCIPITHDQLIKLYCFQFCYRVMLNSTVHY